MHLALALFLLELDGVLLKLQLQFGLGLLHSLLSLMVHLPQSLLVIFVDLVLHLVPRVLVSIERVGLIVELRPVMALVDGRLALHHFVVEVRVHLIFPLIIHAWWIQLHILLLVWIHVLLGAVLVALVHVRVLPEVVRSISVHNRFSLPPR